MVCRYFSLASNYTRNIALNITFLWIISAISIFFKKRKKQHLDTKIMLASTISFTYFIHTYIHTYFICHVGQYNKAAKKLMWTYKSKYIYNNFNNNVNKLKNYLQWVEKL